MKLIKNSGLICIECGNEAEVYTSHYYCKLCKERINRLFVLTDKIRLNQKQLYSLVFELETTKRQGSYKSIAI